MRLTLLMLLAHTVRSLSWAFNAAAIVPGQALTALWLATRVLDDLTLLVGKEPLKAALEALGVSGAPPPRPAEPVTASYRDL